MTFLVDVMFSFPQKCRPRHSFLILIKRLEECGAQFFGEQLGALGIQVRAVNKRGFGQFGVLKRQEHENALLGSGLLNLFGSVLHVHSRRNQKEKTRAIMLR